MSGLEPMLSIRLPEDADGATMTIYGTVGAECQADLADASASRLAGTVTCHHMQSNLAGAHGDIGATVSFVATP